MIRKPIVLITSILLVLGLTACHEENIPSASMPEHELFTQEELDSFGLDNLTGPQTSSARQPAVAHPDPSSSSAPLHAACKN